MTEARILLVDGGPQGSGGYQAQLEADGFAMYRADTLRAAWFAVEEILPDLILLDVTLPDGSGLDFCQALRASHRMPVLFFTCQADQEVDALLLGGDDYIVKPCPYPVLHARIVAALRRRLPEPRSSPVRLCASTCSPGRSRCPARASPCPRSSSSCSACWPRRRGSASPARS